MKSKLSVHYIPIHGRPTDLDYIAQLNPPAIKIVDPDPQRVVDVYQRAPNATFVLRDWALSEQHDNLKSNPIGTAQEHAASWRKRLDDWQARGFKLPPNSQIVVLGINEPHVWEARDQAVQYTVEFLNQCRQHGMRAGALNLSVGWPANTGTDTPVDWTPYEIIHPLLADGYHLLVLHEYWSTAGPSQNMRWWAGRFQQCPWNDIKILIGECGLDVVVERGDVDPNHRGWAANLRPDQYVAQLGQYDDLCLADPRIVGAMVFTTDFGSRNWASFDTDGIRQQLVAMVQAKPDQQPVEKPTQPEPTFNTTALATVNRRKSPGLGYEIIDQILPGQVVQLGVSKIEADGIGWHTCGIGYVAEATVDGTPLFGTYVPPQAQTKFEHAMEFVLRWEGGYANNPADPGGETNFGISKRSYPELDIKNLTKDQAIAIYKRDYWDRCGAEQMPWPLALIHFDSAVNCGVGQAGAFLSGSGNDVLKYCSERLQFYTHLNTFQIFGAAWTRRVADAMIQ